MKNLRTTLICAFITLFSLNSTVQAQQYPLNEPDYNKPRLFDNLPAEIPISTDKLNSLLNERAGISISTNISSGAVTALFQGQVVSSVSKYADKLQTVYIKSTNYNGATLHISKVTLDDGNIKYNGRLMSFKHGDLYILQQKNGEFSLVKKNYYDLVNE